MPLSAPSQMGDLLNQADCLGHTMIVAPTEFIEHIPTVNTKPGEKSPAIRVNVADFNDPDNPVIYRGVLWFGVISGNLRRNIGEFVAGRMAQGQASPGRNAPWQLQDITNEADWMAHLLRWLDNSPAGEAFQAEAITETNRAAASAQVTAASGPQPQAAPAPAPVASRPPAPVSSPSPAPSASRPPAPPAAPAPGVNGALTTPSAAVASAPAGDLAAQLAGLPPEEVAKVLAVLGNQGQATS